MIVALDLDNIVKYPATLLIITCPKRQLSVVANKLKTINIFNMF